MRIADLAKCGSRKKKAWLSVLVILAGILVALCLASCGEEATTTTAAPSSTAPTTATSVGPTESTAPTETTTAEVQPVKGGKIRWILPTLPQSFYYPEMTPQDLQSLMPGMERLLTINSKRELAPQLAESIEEDPDNLTFTIHVRKGVKLHDGSELNAELVKWILEEVKKAGKLDWAQYYESFEVKDPYTVVAHVTQWNNAMLACLGDVPIYSREAVEKNGVEWCRANFVGTGPFKVKEFQRDQKLVWVRNPDYWQEGLPYLDEIEILHVTDYNTARAAMEAGDIDIWAGASNEQLVVLKEKGIVLKSAWSGRFDTLIPNLVDPNSPMHNPKVREAVEYALDREALNNALGYGFNMPVYEFSAPGHAGYGAAASTKREYNPEKAKQLLAEAGYPDGAPITILAQSWGGGGNTQAEAIKGYLEEGGFKVTLDLADMGRYWGSIFGTGWKDLVIFGICGYDHVNDLIDLSFWWSGLWGQIRLASWQPTQELVNLFNEALALRDAKAVEAKIGEIVALLSKDVLVIPMDFAPQITPVQPWLHIDYPDSGAIHCDLARAWAEKH
ncbi:MAG: ABC transporter substrate-binding protein [Thermoleophilia bacterium]|nr:ABC transporter substrate-binding protein [Thermoleophilia bacterium]